MPLKGRLVWDAWNQGHIRRHNISTEEVEEVWGGRHQAVRSREGTLEVLGQTAAGRYIAIFLAPRGKGRYYVITARDMNNAERRRYRKWLKRFR